MSNDKQLVDPIRVTVSVSLEITGLTELVAEDIVKAIADLV